MSSTPEEAQLAQHYARQARARIIGTLRPRFRSQMNYSLPLARFLSRNA